MVQSNGKSQNRDAKGYTPEVEFEYLDADVWIEEKSDGSKKVSYTEEVLDAIEDEESDDSSKND
ncbi:MAG: hypothetical protein HC916_18595 [Coleofasciculaceae cyanobacterium SM2_1_6]|nr:hypothetical protein [Coleofasciculaceae cyanobacterium SM2_1_6]